MLIGLASLLLGACSSIYDELPVEWPDNRPQRETVPVEFPDAETRPVDIETIPTDELSMAYPPTREQKLATSTLPTGAYPQRIALLLPLTSAHGRAAEAFQRGFMEAYQNAPQRLEVRTYDTGAEAELASLYYQSAVNDGYEMVVGPFGKKAVDALIYNQPMVAPALLIGQLPEEAFVANAWGLSLSPENEARSVAEYALQQGHTRAAVLHRNNEWGLRVAEAFNAAFLAGGGQIANQNRFQPGANQASPTIQRLLGLDQSERRFRELKSTLGRPLEFSASRRSDIDFVFFAGNASEARRVVPQLKFFRAHDLPILATSSAFSGKPDPVTDADLAGLRFPDIPWMLQGLDSSATAPLPDATDLQAEVTQPTGQRLRSQSRALPYGGSVLDRLYALGKTAFTVIPQINDLTRDPQGRHFGETMVVSVDETGNLRREFSWARFTQNGIRVNRP